MFNSLMPSLNIRFPSRCQYLSNAILTTGIYPDQWCEAIISPLHKKGPKSNVTNYQGISLLCTISKIFTKVLNNRLVRWAEHNDKLDDSQGAYRKGRSTVDHMFSLYSIIQKYLRKRGGRFYVAFIDFSCAFDSIPHSTLWYRLLQDGIHGRIITVFRSMYIKIKIMCQNFKWFYRFLLMYNWYPSGVYGEPIFICALYK